MSLARAADDFGAIRARIEELRRAQSEALSASTSTTVEPEPAPRRAADDVAAVARNKWALGLKGDVAYPKG